MKIETKYEGLIKSKKRVKDFAEVYTPNWLVKDMVALTNADNPTVTVLEPACGNGNFLAEILSQKLSNCNTEYEALISVKSLFGIDIQEDNVKECRERLCSLLFERFPNSDKKEVESLLQKNIVCGNFLTKKHWSQGKETDELICFLEDERQQI